MVAARLISGHINATEINEIARTRWNGFSFSGFTIFNAFLFAIVPTKKKSSTNAIGPMMTSSWNADRNTSLLIPPMFSAMLYQIIAYTMTNTIIIVKITS